MAWNRGATLVTVLLFLAFGFEVIGVFSEPVSRNKLSLASYKGYDYGVLGYCPTDGSKACSKAGLGYDLHDSKDFSFSKSAQHTLTQLFIAHIVAAGCLLISFVLGIVAHFASLRFYIALEVWLCLIFLLTVLVFVVEILLFGKHLKFTGWFALVAAILTVIAVVVLGMAYRSLRSSLGRTNIEPSDADPLFGNIVSNPKGSDFIVGRDDEKRSQTGAVPFQSFVPPKPPSVVAPALKSVNVQQGYERIPNSEGDHVPHSVKSKASRDDYRVDPRQAQLSQEGLAGQVGAADPRIQNGAQGPQGAMRMQPPQTYQRQPPQQQLSGQNYQRAFSQADNAAGTAGTVGTTGAAGTAGAVTTTGTSGAVTAATSAGAAGLAGVAGASGAAAAAAQGQRRQPRSQREDTWSQIALQKENESGAQRPRHAPQDSIASSQAARIPAGAYMPGVDTSNRNYGPNVVKIPKVREPEQAILDYYQDDTETRPQAAGTGSKVPNYSRLSADSPQGDARVNPQQAQDAPRGLGLPARPPQPPSTPKKMNPMLQRYVESVPETPHRAEEPFYDAPNLRMVSESPAGSESSHYTSISERHARNVAAQAVPPPPPALAASRQWPANNPHNVPQGHHRQPGHAPSQYVPAQMPPQQRPAQHMPQQYVPQYAPQHYAPQPYAPSPQQQYATQQQYAPQQHRPQQHYAPQQQYMQQQPVYVSPAKAPKPAGPQRSEFALNNNPDFSLGNMGNRRRRQNRGPLT